MGQVYLAEDTSLSRNVALKLLLGTSNPDGQRLERFRQEARSASALNHPNIITVYEIGEIDGVLFIATEFIEGVTLREQMSARKVSIDSALDVATQTAGALSEAHEAGLVHRDIKPENIMIRPDGYVKILDFGLAKLCHPEVSADDVATVVPGITFTTPGLVVGTAQYMSPEQARGLNVDTRSDIFSLGTVLYEMLAGESPFPGDTLHHKIVAILEKDAKPLTQVSPEIPQELDRIVSKMLEKNPELRYQSTKDLSIDLHELRRKREVETEMRRRDSFIQPAIGHEANTDSAYVAAGSASVPPRKRGPRGKLLWTATALVLVASAGWFGMRFHPMRAARFQSLSLQQLTDTGQIDDAVISVDGRYIVYAQSQQGQVSLNLRQVKTGSDVRIQEPFAGAYQGLTISADGEFVYFIKAEGGKNVLYRVPSLGGAAKKLRDDVDTAITLSPDGKRFAFGHWADPSGEWQLMITAGRGASQQVLTSLKLPAYLTSPPSWSPDGKWIAFWTHRTDASGSYGMVDVVPAGGGSVRHLGPRWGGGSALTWMPDGHSLVVAASQGGADSQQIWSLDFSGGTVRRLTHDLNSYSTVSVTANAKFLLTVQNEQVSSLWLQNADSPESAREITIPGSRYEGTSGIGWTPDGRIVYTLKGGTGMELWVREPGAGDAKRLISESASMENPTISADGRYITFASNRASNVWHLWRYDIQEGNFKQLTNGAGEIYGTLSPDGNTLVYVELDKEGLWKQVEGRRPMQVTSEADEFPSLSPDGKMIAFTFEDKTQNNRTLMGVRSSDGGDVMKRFDFAARKAREIEWLPNSNALSYIAEENGVSQVWLQPLSGGAPRPVTGFHNCSVFRYAWSMDAKRLALSRGNWNSDVVLFRDGQ